MKIGDLARRTGLTTHALRYYEKIGLLPDPGRNRSRHRDYDPSILVWMEFVKRLKTTGMPISEMVRYAALRQGGSATEAERRQILEAHRDRVRAQVANLQSSLSVLDNKIAGYAGQSVRMKDDDTDRPSPREPLRAGKTQAFGNRR